MAAAAGQANVLTYEQLFICHTLDAHTVDGLTEIFRVLGDPTRVRILDALVDGRSYASAISPVSSASPNRPSRTSSACLRNTRIVRSRREGRMIFYALDDKHVLALFRQGLRHVQEAGR